MTKRKKKSKPRTSRTSMRCTGCNTLQGVVLKNLHHEAGLKCWKCGSKVVRNTSRGKDQDKSGDEVTIPRPSEIPVCPYCSSKAKLVTGSAIYPGRSDLAFLNFYSCKRCDAYVGCHKGTEIPFGTLANAALRRARQCAHRSFDERWKDGKQDRRDAYQWLSEQLGIPQDECHIGMFDFDQCQKVIKLTEFKAKLPAQTKRPKQDHNVAQSEKKLTLEDYCPIAHERTKLAESEKRHAADKKARRVLEKQPEEVNIFDLSNEPNGF